MLYTCTSICTKHSYFICVIRPVELCNTLVSTVAGLSESLNHQGLSWQVTNYLTYLYCIEPSVYRPTCIQSGYRLWLHYHSVIKTC